MTPDRLKKRVDALEDKRSDRKGFVVFLTRSSETREEAEARMALEYPDGVDVVVWLQPGDERI
jgi:hypothetical protein